MTNENGRIHLKSVDSIRRNQEGSEGPKDRAERLKYAIFYLVVAVILFVTNQPAKHSMHGANQSQSPSNLHLDLSVARKVELNGLGSHAAEGGAYLVRFRLMNQGNQPIFYPLSPETNRPIGHIVYRVASQSAWKSLSELESPLSTRAQLDGRGVAWIEIPPGGWADGEYEDPGSPPGDHAYELDLKVARDGKVSPVVSRAYPVNTN